MANGTTSISYKLEANVDGLKPVSDTFKDDVHAICHTYKEIPADGKAWTVPVQPATKGPPHFVLIRPILPDTSKITFSPERASSTALLSSLILSGSPLGVARMTRRGTRTSLSTE